MAEPTQKIVQYLNEAHATELALTRVLQSQIAITPAGSYRSGLEKHLGETHDHARRVQRRLNELDSARNPLQVAVGVAEGVLGQALALAKTPLDLVRGASGEEKVLKNAKDTCATEALEIATYIALERVARAAGDVQTADLAESIRQDEQNMLDRVLGELPTLADAVIGSEVHGKSSFDVSETGAAETARDAKKTVDEAARDGKERAKATARQARKVPGITQAEGRAKGAVATEEDLAIARYDDRTADEITGRLTDLSQIELAKVNTYERKNGDRTTVLDRISVLRGDEPWASYDELSVAEIAKAVRAADNDTVRTVVSYERAHKNRAGVLNAAERDLAGK
jgi:ferritin-like metal-binding protein YciE